MPKANLQRKLNCKVVLPMVIGMLITLAASYIPFFLSFPTWIDSITDDMIDDRTDTLETLSQYLALAAGSTMNYPSDFLLLSGRLYNKYYNKELRIKSTFSGITNYVNGHEFTLGNKNDVYGLDRATNKSFATSVWYLQDTYYINNIIDNKTLANLKDSAIFDVFTRPIIKLGNPKNKPNFFQRAYLGFDYDGLFYTNPAEDEDYFISFPESRDCIYMNDSIIPLYDPRCRPWFELRKNFEHQDRISITEPYIFAEGAYVGQTFCIGDYRENVFNFASCLDYDMRELSSKIDVIDSGSTTYAFAVSPKGATFVHPDFKGTCKSEDNSICSIATVEMSGSSSAEEREFKKNIVTKFNSDKSSIAKYKKDGKTIIIAISPVLGKVGLDGFKTIVANVGLRIEESTMTDPFDDLKSNLNQLMYIEGVALFIIIVIVLVLCWVLTRYVTLQIIRPIDNLIKILERLKDGDVDIIIEDHYQLCSKELTKLYTVFTKLKIVLKFGKKTYFSEDSEAIMNYAQALTLFLEFRNMERAGICYNNIGVIHLKNYRYQEAIACFAKAYELAQTLKNKPEIVNKRQRMLATTMLCLKKFDKKPPQLMLDLIETYKYNKEYTKAAECLIILAEHAVSNITTAEKFLYEAEELIDIHTSFDIPKEILHAKLIYCKGLILIQKGLLKQACETFIGCMSMYKIFDPETRSKCLERLNEIYSKFGIDNDIFITAAAGCKNQAKDVIFVVDYSISMNGSRIKKTLLGICHIVEVRLKPEDRVAFITFNKTCNIAFNLTPRGAESTVLQEKIMKWDSPKGATSFYDAINLSLQEFSAYGPQEEAFVPFDELVIEKEIRVQWVIGLVDGEDNTSSYTFKQIRKRLLKSEVNLIMVGLNLPKEFKEIVRELCQSTSRGIYIDCPNLSDLEKAFQTISVFISSKSDGIESLD